MSDAHEQAAVEKLIALTKSGKLLWYVVNSVSFGADTPKAQITAWGYAGRDNVTIKIGTEEYSVYNSDVPEVSDLLSAIEAVAKPKSERPEREMPNTFSDALDAAL